MGKRSIKAAHFFEDSGVSFRILLQNIICAPCDRIFHSIFDAESFDNVDDRGRRFLFSSMCNPNPCGAIAKTHAELGQMLTDPDSDVNFIVNKLGTTAALRDEYLTKAEAAIMRQSADLYRRFVLTFSTYPYKLLRMVDMGIDERTEFAHEFLHTEPDCCMDMFAKRVKAVLGTSELLLHADTLRAFKSVAEDPLLMSVHHCELQHAQARSATTKSHGARRQCRAIRRLGTLKMAQRLWANWRRSQFPDLSRREAVQSKRLSWSKVASSAMKEAVGKRWTAKAGARTKMRKTKHATLNGESLFISQRCEERRASGVKSTRAVYWAWLQHIHAEFQGMSPEDKQVYEDDARVKNLRRQRGDVPADHDLVIELCRLGGGSRN